MPEETTPAACACGKVVLEAAGRPIMATACHCTSCRTAGRRFERGLHAPQVIETDGGTEFVLQRKDRVRCLSGSELLVEHRLTPASKTRRVVARCCGSPMFLEFESGHWLSIYRRRFAPDARPPVELRTMTRDCEPGTVLDDAVPSYRTHSGKFMWKLLAAWAAMGFRSPKLDYVRGGAEIHGS